MGQGACQAIEDAVVLAKCMQKNKDYEIAFQSFEQLRLKRTHWITNTSYKIGELAQIENPIGILLRNTALKMIPNFIKQVQQKKINNYFNNESINQL